MPREEGELSWKFCRSWSNILKKHLEEKIMYMTNGMIRGDKIIFNN